MSNEELVARIDPIMDRAPLPRELVNIAFVDSSEITVPEGELNPLHFVANSMRRLLMRRYRTLENGSSPLDDDIVAQTVGEYVGNAALYADGCNWAAITQDASSSDIYVVVADNNPTWRESIVEPKKAKALPDPVAHLQRDDDEHNMGMDIISGFSAQEKGYQESRDQSGKIVWARFLPGTKLN